MVKRAAGEESDLDRIQDLFPSDNLRLNEKETFGTKMKGLIRKRSTPAARLQRALSAKALRPPSNERSPNECGRDGGLTTNRPKLGQENRQFIMETSVQFTTALQSQERHLFLFSDLLLVGKARSARNFKMKDKVRVSEMWLGLCLDDVCEVTKSLETSFVMGWPTINVVATFSSAATRELWWQKLNQVIAEEREKEPKSTTIQVNFNDTARNIEYCKTVSVCPTDTADSCIRLALDHLEIRGLDPVHFQLWVKTGVDESPYPLIGHEYPFAIKMNCLREFLSTEEGFDLDHCNNIYNADPVTKCQFTLKNNRKTSFSSTEGLVKKSKKTRKSPIRIHKVKVFKRSNSKTDSIDISMCSSGMLFKQPLQRLCEIENLPKPVMDMLQQLFMKGPFTQGIFRKSANARLVRELRDKLDSELEVDLEDVQIFVVAALLMDFLRSLPDCLLESDLYEVWLSVVRIKDDVEKIHKIQSICEKLPKANLTLLQHFICVMYHIARKCSENMMSASNLAICVGQSILWSANPSQALTPESSKHVPGLVEFMIDRCENIFGSEVLKLFGDPPERDPTRQDSGAEESDSLHSMHSGHSLHSGGGMRRDDSSIDSLEREFLGDGEPSPLPRKDKMSITNLSRDSGLTMSDTQLYTPDEEESESTSSGHSGDKSEHSTSSSGHGSDKNTCHYEVKGLLGHYTATEMPSGVFAAAYRKPNVESGQYTREKELHGGYSGHYSHSKLTATFSTPLTSSSEKKEYTPVYQSRADAVRDVYRKNADDPMCSRPLRQSSKDSNSEVINSNFQRQDWSRRKSNLKRYNRSLSVSQESSGLSPLRRSASEESLPNSFSNTYSQPKRPALHRKGRAPLPPPSMSASEEPLAGTSVENTKPSPQMIRSKSVHHIGEREHERETTSHCLSQSDSQDLLVDWQRSQSTPHIDEVDRSYDSSTLSDYDSTPHVSRSNSRGKDYNSVGNAGESTYGMLTQRNDMETRSIKSNSSSSRTNSFSTVKSADSTVTITSGTPPSYEETLSRQKLLQKQPSGNSQKSRTSVKSVSIQNESEQTIHEHSARFAHAKQLYQESVRIFSEQPPSFQSDLVHAAPVTIDSQDSDNEPPPLPPKSDPPPLPPKQKVLRKAASEGIKLKLRLPPVHVDLEKEEISFPICKHSSVKTVPMTSCVESKHHHKKVFEEEATPPTLPVKESTNTKVETVYAQLPRNANRKTVTSSINININSPSVKHHSVETQTDDLDLYRLRSEDRKNNVTANLSKVNSDVKWKDEEIQVSGNWIVDVPEVTAGNNVVTAETQTTPEVRQLKSDRDTLCGPSKRRGRARRKDISSLRSKSLPPKDRNFSESDSDEDLNERWGRAHSQVLLDVLPDQPNQPSAVIQESKLNFDPSLRSEISWSVSQLRTLYLTNIKDSKKELGRRNAGRTVAQATPPPYRYPPSVIPSYSQNVIPNNRAPITSFHLGNSQSEQYVTQKMRTQIHKRSDSTDSSYGEESYV